jgi:hypothetical protein
MGRNGAVIVVAPAEGREVTRVNGERTVINAGRGVTRGAYAVRENTVPPAFTAVPSHIHRDAEEAFYVLSGRLSVLAGERRAERTRAPSCSSRAARRTGSPISALSPPAG